MSERDEVLAHARLLLSSGEAAQSAELLEPHAQAAPEDAAVWTALAAAYFELQRWPEAEAAARRVTELEPANARNWCNYGTVLRKLGQLDAAEDAQREALRQDAGYARARGELRKLDGLQPLAPPKRRDATSDGVGAAQMHRGRSPARDGAQLAWGVAIGASVLALLLFTVLLAVMTDESERVDSLPPVADAVAAESAPASTVADTSAPTPAPSYQPPPQPLPAPVAAPARPRAVDASLTVDYIDQFQSPGRGGERFTDAQRKACWEANFGGRRVRWRGEVVSVTEFADSYTVGLKCGSSAVGSDTRFDVDRTTALALRKGQIIVVEGTLADHSAFGYRLDKAVIVAW